MNCFRFFFLVGWLCLAAAALGAAGASPAEDPSRAREQADRSLTVAAQKQTAYPLWDGKESVAQYARKVNLPETQTLDLGNGVTLELVLIPAGKFIMGTPEPQPVDEAAFHRKIVTGQAVLAAGGGILLVLIGFAILRAIRERRRFQYSLRRLIAMTFAAGLCVLGGMHWWQSQRNFADAREEYSEAVVRFKEARNYEQRAHVVTITKPFYMGKYVVTQQQYQQVMGVNPSDFRGLSLPVETVLWGDATEFCRKASGLLIRDREVTAGPPANARGSEMLLPTEAEWEYACRAGTVTTYYTGNKESDLARAGWYDANSGRTTHPVGQKEPNAWGLYDMHGNVYQWCADLKIGCSPRGERQFRVLRGGAFNDEARTCRATAPRWDGPTYLYHSFGFRVMVKVRTP